jgi:SOS response regulatory protein OraA/RecX
VNETYLYALKLLRGHDYTVAMLREKLAARFGYVPRQVLDQLIDSKFLNDRRFAENYVARRKDRGARTLREELVVRGVAASLTDEILSQTEWPSLQEALAAKMDGWKLRTPLQSRDAARLFRAMLRLGYDEDAIREEIEQLHEQQ